MASNGWTFIIVRQIHEGMHISQAADMGDQTHHLIVLPSGAGESSGAEVEPAKDLRPFTPPATFFAPFRVRSGQGEVC